MARAPKKNIRSNQVSNLPNIQEKSPKLFSFLEKATGIVMDKDKDNLLNQDESLRKQLYNAIEKLQLSQQEAETSKMDYEKQILLLEEQNEQLIVKENKINQDEDELLKLKNNLNAQKNEILEEKKQWSQTKSEITKQQLDIQQQLLQLNEEKENAQLGFEKEKVAALAEKGKALEALQAEYFSKLTTEMPILLKKEKELLERERNLYIEEEKAKAGFLQAKQLAFDEQCKEIEAFKLKSLNKLKIDLNVLEEKEAKIFEREQSVIQAEAKAQEGFLRLKKELMREWDEQKASEQTELQRIQKQNEQEKIELEHARREIQSKNDKFDASLEAIKRKYQREFSVEITELTSEKDSLRESHSHALSRIEELTQKLQQYADLERQLDGQGISSIQEELQELRDRNRDLRAKLSERSEEGLEEENERLERLCDDFEQQVFDFRQKNNELESELNNTRLSVLEKQHLQQEKRVLTEHKRILDVSIMQLKTQIDDLIKTQEGEWPFKSLSEMDQLYRGEARGLQNVPSLESFAQMMQSHIAMQGLYYGLADIRLFIAGLAMSKLHLLQGISGTGKTSLARAFAKAMNNIVDKDQEKQYCEIIRVQAGWRDREDLLGHFNAFEKRFYTKEALQALYRAQQPKFKDTLQIILLDEMNLSQPEQYFADFLSLMETPDRAEISLLDSANEKAPDLFIDKRAIKIPENVWFIGTANHDETTKEFADKTYDRAHVMEVRRSKEHIDIQYASSEQFSYSSLMQKFKQSEKKHKEEIDRVFNHLKDSLLESALQAVDVSWGNRLERQAKSFIPVYLDLGGTVSEALDHLLATKLFRRGKVTGRYDTRADKVEDIITGLHDAWEICKFEEAPHISLDLLQNDVERLKGNL